MFEWIYSLDAWLGLFTLVILEIILGIDNIIFLSIIVLKLPKKQQALARQVGLWAAMLMRILLLMSIAWIAHLTVPLFYVDQGAILFYNVDPSTLVDPFLFSIRDAILWLGGLFLVWKGISEIRELFRPVHEAHQITTKTFTFSRAIIEIMMLDIIFSLDSVITAVGIGGDHLAIMVMAIVISVIIMMFAARPIGDFINSQPAFKMLAITFLILVGAILVLDSLHLHVSKNYLYFALFFSLFVEVLNYRYQKRQSASDS